MQDMEHASPEIGELQKTKMKTVIVGAGPVGAMAGIYAARRGHEVEVYELRGGEWGCFFVAVWSWLIGWCSLQFIGGFFGSIF